MIEALDFLEVDQLPDDLASNKGVLMYLAVQDRTYEPGMYFSDGTSWNMFLRSANPAFKGTLRGPRYGEIVQEITANSATTNIDVSAGSYIVLTLAQATAVTFTNLPAAGTAAGFTLEVVYGGFALTFSQTVKWNEKTTPTQTPTGTDIFAFYSRNGSTLIGAQALKDFG